MAISILLRKHLFYRAVESGEFGSGCTTAWCSTAFKPDHVASDSDGVIEISTTKEGMEEIGMKLINKVERNILYRHREVEGPHRRHGKPRQKTWLYWNGGEPSFVKL